MGPASKTRVLLVSPRFNPDSFWSFRATCSLQGARWLAPPLGLITLAAMLPKSWDVRLVDRNVEDLTDSDIAGADLVLTGGMLPQEVDLRAVMARCARLRRPVCIGGPAPTSTPDLFEDADFIVVGEAESAIDDFVAAWERGERRGRFVAPKFQADVTKTPMPRFELLTFRHYLYVNVQFSRGCPFTCEFCDIIELYGRVPRTKTAPQMLAELDRLHELGYRGHVDFVDDNLIGNKKAIKLFLPHLIAWQQRRRYPFEFSTEASLNLADDPDLLEMMRLAKFRVLFTGIETPDEATLVQTQKKQNTRRSIPESVRRIQEAGMLVTAGFIIGFDEEKGRVSAPMLHCIEEAGIPASVVGLLTALPNTQLSRRLSREGRLFEQFRDNLAVAGDSTTSGLNFTTLRPRQEILQDFREVVDQAFRPGAYFRRARHLGARLRLPRLDGEAVLWRLVFRNALSFLRLSWQMTFRYPEARKSYWGALHATLLANPPALPAVGSQGALFLHLYPYSRKLLGVLDEQIRRLAAEHDDTVIALLSAAAEVRPHLAKPVEVA